MLHELMISGILLLGGLGCRFNNALPKQFHKISGEKVYLRTLKKFCEARLFDEIVLVCHPDWIGDVQEDIADMDVPVRVVAGGASRQESAHLGILASKGDYVVIHDAVRPFVSERILRENVEAAIAYGAVDTCIPSTDTLVYSQDGETIDNIPNRDHYLRGQTPQSFRRDIILQAHAEAKSSDGSCECRLVREMGHPVHIVMGEERNLKITSMLDLFMAEQLLRMETATLPETTVESLEGKKYVLAGGTSGIGQALADRLRALGAEPIVIGRSAKQYTADLTRPEEVHRVFQRIHRDHGAVDGLINCVGMLKVGKADFLSSDELRSLIDTNFTATVEACKACIFKEGAHIVNLSSSSFYRGRPLYAVYSSMKAAIVNFTQGYAEEHPELRVNVVVPQRTSTPMRWSNFPGENQNTLLSPQVVAETITDLLGTTHCTGTIFEVKKGSKKPEKTLGLLY